MLALLVERSRRRDYATDRDTRVFFCDVFCRNIQTASQRAHDSDDDDDDDDVDDDSSLMTMLTMIIDEDDDKDDVSECT